MDNTPKDKTSSNNMDKNKKKKQGTMDKVIFGLLIGGAIGSVLGLTVAPDKGKKVRKKIKKGSDDMIDKSKDLLEEHEDAIAVVTSKSKGVISFFTDKILGKKNENEGGSILDWISDMDEIPSEAEEEISQ